MRTTNAAATLLLITTLDASDLQAQHRAEGVAAVVGAATPRPGADVILRSDVDLRARLRLAGATTGESHDALPLAPLPDSLLQATLEELVGEYLIAREADRVQVATPTDADVRTERERLDGIGGGSERTDALLRALGADTSELDEAALRRAKVKVFLDANLDSAPIDDAEIDRIYTSGEHPFLGQDLEDVRDAMRVWLMRGAALAAARRWVEVLSARTVVSRPFEDAP